MEHAPAAKPGALTFAAHAAFVPTGIVTVLLGPLLPSLAARWLLNDAQAGYLFTAQFAGSMLGVALSAFVVARFGYRVAIIAGLLMMAAGVAVLPLSPWLLGLACVVFYGFGLGLTIPACNLAVAAVHPVGRGAALNLLNFSWSVGAVACPFLLAAYNRGHHTSWFLYSLGGLIVAVSLLIMGISMPEQAASAPQPGGARSPVNWANRYILILGSLFLLYVGTENAVGGWLASFAERISTGGGVLWVMTPSCFYGALLFGRGIAPLLLRDIHEIMLARAGLLTATLGVASLLFAHTVGAVMAGAAVAGLGLSAVYPITISMLSQKFGAQSTRVGSLMFALGNLGGASMPWLVGYCSTQFGSLRSGLAVPLIAGVVMLGLYIGDWQLKTLERSVAAV